MVGKESRLCLPGGRAGAGEGRARRGEVGSSLSRDLPSEFTSQLHLDKQGDLSVPRMLVCTMRYCYYPPSWGCCGLNKRTQDKLRAFCI